jgi:hypothetical protein
MTARRNPHDRKFDRLISPNSSKDEIRCDYACAPFDRLATDMDRKWGINRLQGLVSPAMAEKFGRAVAHLNDCLNRLQPEEAAAAAENCIKGLHAMDREASFAGHQPASPEIWQIEIDGRDLVFIRQADMWQAAQDAIPGCTVYTLREAAHALAQCNLPMVSDIKAAFPGAQVSAVRSRTETEEYLNDDLPF